MQQQPQKQVKLIKSHNGQEEFAIVLDEQLGQGNFGVVRRAINMADRSQKLVAKIIPLDESRRPNVEAELRVIRELPEHDNLVRVLPVKCYSTHNYYILMEYCEGSLAQMLRSGCRLSEEEQMKVFFQLVSGYKVLFDRKILHQDLKPDNILVSKGTYKISDFGLSVFYEAHRYDERREGTVSYIAPEKLTLKEYRGNPKSDVYSMGVIMFELLTGRGPYADYRGDLKQFVQELKEAPLRLPPRYTNMYSLKMLPLVEVIIQMVAKTESSRISFEEIWKFVNQAEVFEGMRGDGVPMARRKSSEGMANAELVVSQRSRVVTLPLDTSEHAQNQLKKSLMEEQNKELAIKKEEAAQEITDFLIEKRVLVYYFDKLARRLTVEQMRLGYRSPPVDRVILSLVIANRCILNALVREIQSPAIFTSAKWRLFRSHPSKSLMDIVMKDYRYVEDTTCDLLAEEVKVSKKDQIDMLQCLKEDNLDKLLAGLASALEQLLKERAALIEVKNKSSLKTLAYMITAVSIVDRLRKHQSQPASLEQCHRRIETSTETCLLEEISSHCSKGGLVYSLDFSGVSSTTESQILQI